MKEPFPNLAHWQLTEASFRVTDGRGWRRAAASFLHVDSKKLRATYDRDLSGPEIDSLLGRIQSSTASRRSSPTSPPSGPRPG